MRRFQDAFIQFNGRMAAAMVNADGSATSDQQTPATKNENKRFRVGPILLVMLWGLAIVIVVWTYRNPRFGAGMRHSISAVALLVPGLVSFLWFVTCSRFSRSVRYGTALAAFGTLATAIGLLRVEEVTGSLVPRFAWRWSPRPDELLEAIPEGRATANAADLATATPHDFPRFLGPNGNLGVDTIRLHADWQSRPPELLWKQPIGAGWSAFSAVNGYAVTMEQRGEMELTTCYQIETGKLIWSSGVRARHETLPGGVGPRATPTIADGRVYVQGATGILRCLNGSDGSTHWHVDLKDRYLIPPEDQSVLWGRAGSPLLVDEKVIVPVGGWKEANGVRQRVALVALDKNTGEEIWTGGQTQISYASPAYVQLLSIPMILIVLEDSVAAFDPEDGRTLWTFPWPGRSDANANVSQAVAVGEDRVFVSKGYGQGAALLQIVRQGDGTWSAQPVWEIPTIMKTKFSNVAPYQGHVYGLDDVILECVDLSSGQRKWKRGRYGYGQLLRVSEKLLVLAEDGELILGQASPDRWQELGRIEALQGKTWNNLCLYGSYLLLRNGQQAACFRLATEPSEETR